MNFLRDREAERLFYVFPKEAHFSNTSLLKTPHRMVYFNYPKRFAPRNYCYRTEPCLPHSQAQCNLKLKRGGNKTPRGDYSYISAFGGNLKTFRRRRHFPKL